MRKKKECCCFVVVVILIIVLSYRTHYLKIVVKALQNHTHSTHQNLVKILNFSKVSSPFCFVLLSEGLFRRKTHRLLLLQHNDNDNISHRIYNHTEYNSEIKNDTNDVFFFFFSFFFLVAFLGGGSKPEKQNSITSVISVVFKKDGDDDEKKKKKNFLGKIVIFDRIIGETESFDFGFR